MVGVDGLAKKNVIPSPPPVPPPMVVVKVALTFAELTGVGQNAVPACLVGVVWVSCRALPTISDDPLRAQPPADGSGIVVDVDAPFTCTLSNATELVWWTLWEVTNRPMVTGPVIGTEVAPTLIHVFPSIE